MRSSNAKLECRIRGVPSALTDHANTNRRTRRGWGLASSFLVEVDVGLSSSSRFVIPLRYRCDPLRFVFITVFLFATVRLQAFLDLRAPHYICRILGLTVPAFLCSCFSGSESDCTILFVYFRNYSRALKVGNVKCL